MDGLREYLISVMAASLICSSVNMVIGSKGTPSKLIQLLGGVFLATVVLNPVIKLKLTDYRILQGQIEEACEEAVAEGEAITRSAIMAELSEQTCLRIYRQGQELGCSLDVEIVWEEYIPVSVTLEGEISPYAKEMMSKWIRDNIGIGEESQNWTG